MMASRESAVVKTLGPLTIDHAVRVLGWSVTNDAFGRETFVIFGVFTFINLFTP